jgi:hypothetical protein
MRLRIAALLLAGWVGIAHAADTVTIGAVDSFGRDPAARAAIETAEDIVNTPHPGLENLPLGSAALRSRSTSPTTLPTRRSRRRRRCASSPRIMSRR